ncbi:unnamed protein product [Euphydryas editha]|uniref:Uncharacterized protein n=1 Tax=Euphydryas editha TaxID=104508 RepID=A0AAU9UHY3_EUPED|nr:unnamed protein product [Euphydryas editha]
MDWDASPPPDGGGGGVGGNKRRSSIERDPESVKKASPPSASVQDTYTDPDYTGIKVAYNQDDKGPFSVHISKLESVQRPGPSIRLLNFAQFLHKNSINGIVKGVSGNEDWRGPLCSH